MLHEDAAWVLTQACVLLGHNSKGLSLAQVGDALAISYEFQRQPLKPVVEWLGFAYTAFSATGRDWAIQHDLSMPLPEEHHGKFDIVLNVESCGEVEHATEGGLGQWQFFKSMHDLAKPTAVLISVLPGMDRTPGHGFKYLDVFLPNLAAQAGYHLTHLGKLNRGRTLGILLKQPSSCFLEPAAFQACGVLRN